MTFAQFPEQAVSKGTKRSSLTTSGGDRPQKRARVLLSEDSDGGTGVDEPKIASADEKEGSASNYVIAVNEDFARRFEHNKKREELQQRMCTRVSRLDKIAEANVDFILVEEKYGARSIPARFGSGGNGVNEGADGSSDSSTDSEEEDDDGVFVSDELDAQIQATLDAIRTKDPRVYDEKTVFYSVDESQSIGSTVPTEPKAKPMYLHDFHRINLLQGDADEKRQNGFSPTYVEQQNELRQTMIKEMHAIPHDEPTQATHVEEDEGVEDDFLVRKIPPSRKAALGLDDMVHAAQLDPKIADKDPEGFLSKFMSAKAWVPSAGSKFQPFESDDEDDDQRAEAFEEAYNLRFEDPKGSNEKLLSHARDAVAKYSVRKEATTSRKKTRITERAKKEAEKKEREIEKARLRKLKVAEAEEKIKRIKNAAGLRGNNLADQNWAAFLSETWDNESWEEEMKKTFGEEYYAHHDIDAMQEGREAVRKLKKPKWEDEIEITDLIPDFQYEEGFSTRQLSITDEDSREAIDGPGGISIQQHQNRSRPRNKDIQKRKEDLKKEARKERRKIEQLVDENLAVSDKLSVFATRNHAPFRYRETSPQAYGLTSHDILMASDRQLNQFVGLKKLATFREADKKKKDKKRLGKKARLREWRRETFGDEHGPQKPTEVPIDSVAVRVAGSDPVEKAVKTKRSRKRAGKEKSGVPGS